MSTSVIPIINEERKRKMGSGLPFLVHWLGRLGLLNIVLKAADIGEALTIEKSGLHSLGGRFSSSDTGFVRDLDRSLVLECEKLVEWDKGLELLEEKGDFGRLLKEVADGVLERFDRERSKPFPKDSLGQC